MILSSVVIILAIMIFDVADDVFALTRHETKMQLLTVSELSELPSALENAGIIKHPQIFSVYIDLTEKKLKRHTASVSPTMDYRALLSAFTDDPITKTVRITIPTSASVSEIIDIFVSYGLGTREGFTAAINEYPFEFDFLSSIPQNDDRLYRLEGYLYPNTYDFYTGRDESYYINKMLDGFESAAGELITLCENEGMSLDQALTVASLIECSAGFPSNYERMSAVIHNRLQKRLPLEIPSSSTYGLSGKSELYIGTPSQSVKAIDSPYNTFKKEGLPPSPICNPSKEAILSAIYPEKSNYMYFVTLKNQSVLFAKTVSDHRVNLDRASED